MERFFCIYLKLFYIMFVVDFWLWFLLKFFFVWYLLNIIFWERLYLMLLDGLWFLKIIIFVYFFGKYMSVFFCGNICVCNLYLLWLVGFILMSRYLYDLDVVFWYVFLKNDDWFGYIWVLNDNICFEFFNDWNNMI